MDLLDDEEPKKPKRTARIAIATYVDTDDAAKLAMIRAKMGNKPMAEVLRRLIRFGYKNVTTKTEKPAA